MNIIDAWKKAKYGEFITRDLAGHMKIEGQGIKDFLKYYGFPDDALLEDKWEVGRKPLVWEGEVRFTEYSADSVYNLLPSACRNFIGKRTRIRIEEII